MLNHRSERIHGKGLKADFMRNDLEGKRAIVTGASKGIGFAIAEALLSQAAMVVICGRNERQLQEAIERPQGRSSRSKGLGRVSRCLTKQ